LRRQWRWLPRGWRWLEWLHLPCTCVENENTTINNGTYKACQPAPTVCAQPQPQPPRIFKHQDPPAASPIELLTSAAPTRRAPGSAPRAEHQAARYLQCGTARIPSISVEYNPVKGVKQRPSANTTRRMHAHTHPHTRARTRTMHARVSTCPNCQCTAPAPVPPHILASGPTSSIAD